MCKSYYKDGFVYEYGPHILAMHNCSEEAAEYIRSMVPAEKTELTSASVIDGTITYYPPSIYSAERLGVAEKVKKEISELPNDSDETNFETYLMSKVGPTLYKLFFEGFTRKFWGIEPSELSADWAKTRRLGENLTSKRMFFNDKWCAYPKKDWNELFNNLLKDIHVLYDIEVEGVEFEKNCVVANTGDRIAYDLLISTMHIDRLFQNRFGELQYAGYRIEPVVLKNRSHTELDGRPISMTYYPDAEVAYCRVTDYGTFQNKDGFPYDQGTILTYEYPDHTKRLYPFTDERNLNLFDNYLREVAKISNVLTFGRMGLYKYLTTDTTVEMAFRMLPWLERWHDLGPVERYEAYKIIRGSWCN